MMSSSSTAPLAARSKDLRSWIADLKAAGELIAQRSLRLCQGGIHSIMPLTQDSRFVR